MMNNILDTVRATVGRRSKITPAEMETILMSVPNLPQVSTIAGRGQDGTLYVGGTWVRERANETRATAQAWTSACSGITCISVMSGGDGLSVRYDQPGTMHPLHRAEVIFAPESLERHEYDQIGQLRQHAKRVLVVRGPRS